MEASTLTGNAVVGEVQTIALTAVRPNGWNPNRMSPHVYESLKHALSTEGWLSSQSLLIWHSDDNGVEKNLIIDGEHRWTVAKELGFKAGPMVFLKGLSEAKAKALTVAMNNRRGQFDDAMLSDLVKSLDGALDNLSLELAISDEDLMKMLPVDVIDHTLGVVDAPRPAVKPQVTTNGNVAESTVRMVSLFLDTNNIDQFTKNVQELSKRYNTKNVTDTVFEALKRQAAEAV